MRGNWKETGSISNATYVDAWCLPYASKPNIGKRLVIFQIYCGGLLVPGKHQMLINNIGSFFPLHLISTLIDRQTLWPQEDKPGEQVILNDSR